MLEKLLYILAPPLPFPSSPSKRSERMHSGLKSSASLPSKASALHSRLCVLVDKHSGTFYLSIMTAAVSLYDDDDDDDSLCQNFR